MSGTTYKCCGNVKERLAGVGDGVLGVDSLLTLLFIVLSSCGFHVLIGTLILDSTQPYVTPFTHSQSSKFGVCRTPRRIRLDGIEI